MWPFAMQIITACIVGSYVLMQRRQGNKQYDCSFFLLGNKHASSMGAIPTYMLALFSLGDQLNAALSAPPGPFVSQPIQSVLTNFVLIWMTILGILWLKVRFKMVHYIGMSLVVVAAFVQFMPFLIDNDCKGPWPNPAKDVTCFESYHSNSGGPDGSWIKMGGGQMIFFYTLFIVSTIPAAVSNVYKQKVLQGVDADIFYVTWWSGWFQLLWGWICIPLMWVNLPGQTDMAPKDTFKIIGETLTCLGGTDPTHGDVPSCVTSPPPWFYVILYFAFNATFNLCITWLTKRISAMWVQVATVLCLNLCNIFSAQKWLIGKNAEPMTGWDWAAAVIVSIALWVYNMEEEVKRDDDKVSPAQDGSVP
jgi:hypothetical protein